MVPFVYSAICLRDDRKGDISALQRGLFGSDLSLEWTIYPCHAVTVPVPQIETLAMGAMSRLATSYKSGGHLCQ